MGDHLTRSAILFPLSSIHSAEPGVIRLTGGVFLLLSLLFFIIYFRKGTRHWGWLYPAIPLLGFSITLFLVTPGVNNPVLSIPLWLSLIIPNLIAYSLNIRQNWWALIPAWVFTILMIVSFIDPAEEGMAVAITLVSILLIPLTIFSVFFPDTVLGIFRIISHGFGSGFDAIVIALMKITEPLLVSLGLRKKR
jgi:hypothetical protein